MGPGNTKMRITKSPLSGATLVEEAATCGSDRCPVYNAAMVGGEVEAPRRDAGFTQKGHRGFTGKVFEQHLEE